MDRLISTFSSASHCMARLRMLIIGSAAIGLFIGAGALPLRADEAQWIWSPDHAKEEVPETACFFRKSFRLRNPVEGQITITADDAYDLFVNGRRVGGQRFPKNLKQYDVTAYLNSGRNTVAVRVTNLKGSTAALVARVMVQESPGGWTSFSTDKSWKTALRTLPLWNTALYNDRLWTPAQTFGALGETPPWDRAEGVAVEQRHRSKRFQIADEFAVDRVAASPETGSLIAMAFNEFGHIIAARENGPLLLLFDSTEDGTFDQVRVYCDEVKNCQGILALNGEVFVTAEGPEGNGLYRLTDSDRNGQLDQVRLLVKFQGEPGEHGAHGIELGGDGLLYVVVGNHAGAEKGYEKQSPHRNFYEGDLVPRYEDPGGHAAGRKAPGGVVLRTDIDGRSVELVAGGLRNAYDLAFNREGELFVHDSDMESDIGTTWYRPTQVYHIVPGGEYGWRSGWSKWPDYYVDSLPAMDDTGRGSPTGAVVYDHFMFPARFHNAIFLADWSEGRILVSRTKPNGAGFTTSTEVFLKGQPLNVTDLAIGPDGWLYFSTGGRGTTGGVYRVSWRGQVPDEIKRLGTGISAIIRQPQFYSPWARQEIASAKQQLGSQWSRLLRNVALSNSNPAKYRVRALDVLQLFGPTPSSELLAKLTQAKSAEVRNKAAQLLGVNGGPEAHEALTRLLRDSDRAVRAAACNALVRAQLPADFATLQPLLGSDDRAEVWAARRLLERIPVEQWRDQVLTSDDHRVFIQGSLALLVAHPSRQNALDVTHRFHELIQSFVTDRDFVDMLRLTQVAILRGNLKPEDVDEIRSELALEFPSGDAIINRELVRLLTHLQVDSLMDAYGKYLESDVADLEKLHLALHLPFLKQGWTSERRLQLLKFFEHAQQLPGGNSYGAYVKNVTRDFAKTLTAEESQQILVNGSQWPNAALASLYKLPVKLDEEIRGRIKRLDEQVARRQGDAYERLRVGIVAVLARSGDAESLGYLREIWKRDPERRPAVAMGLAQHPGGANWEFLVRSLPVLDKGPAREVLKKLASVDQQSDQPEDLRQIILLGLRLQGEGSDLALKLLEEWTGEQPGEEGATWDEALTAWQTWFTEHHPELPAPQLPVDSNDAKWQLAQLVDYLESDAMASASATRGQLVFSKAQCIKCHRFGNEGESMGPDLTSVSKRFTRREIVESVLFPSHVISSQYASKTVLTTDGRSFTGIVARSGTGETTILQDDGRKVVLPNAVVDETLPTRTSSMPAGLLNTLTLEEIGDLFAYLKATPISSVARQPGATPK